jgi:hypothetical protein
VDGDRALQPAGVHGDHDDEQPAGEQQVHGLEHLHDAGGWAGSMFLHKAQCNGQVRLTGARIGGYYCNGTCRPLDQIGLHARTDRAEQRVATGCRPASDVSRRTALTCENA